MAGTVNRVFAGYDSKGNMVFKFVNGLTGEALPDRGLEVQEPNGRRSDYSGAIYDGNGNAVADPGQVPSDPVAKKPTTPPLKTHPDLTGPGSTDPNAVTRPDLLDPIAKPIAGRDTYNFQPFLDEQDKYFNDLLANLKQPSSVDEALKLTETDFMNQLLQGIDEDTTASVGSAKLDFLERGLGGPGQISDIETSALNQARTLGDKTKASTRTQFALSELGRQKEKESALTDVYKTRYGTTADLYKSLLGIQGTKDTALAQILADMEKERLARASGKYAPSSVDRGGGGPSFSIGIPTPIGNIGVGF